MDAHFEKANAFLDGRLTKNCDSVVILDVNVTSCLLGFRRIACVPRITLRQVARRASIEALAIGRHVSGGLLG